MQKRKVLSLEWKSEGVMDDESGELIELMEEVPLNELGDANWRDYSAWLTEGSWELVPETRGSILEGMICFCREDDVGGRASVTKDEKRVLRGG